MAKPSLASLEQFVCGFEGQPFWIGIDVHKQSYSFALHIFHAHVFTRQFDCPATRTDPILPPPTEILLSNTSTISKGQWFWEEAGRNRLTSCATEICPS